MVFTKFEPKKGNVEIHLCGKRVFTMTDPSREGQNSDADYNVRKLNTEWAMTAREMAETSHNLNRTGSIATVKKSVVIGAKTTNPLQCVEVTTWIWCNSGECWARLPGQKVTVE